MDQAQRTLFFHLGPVKTGTSAVQHVLSRHDNARVIYPKTGLWKDGAHHNLVFNFFADTSRPETQRADSAAMLADIAAQAARSTRDLVISSEALVGRDIGRLVDALLQQLGRSDWNVELILVCREHYARAASLYNQEVKDSVRMEKCPPGDFLRRFAATHSYQAMIGKLAKTGLKLHLINYHPTRDFLPRFMQHIGYGPMAPDENQARNVSLSVKGMIATLAANSVARSMEDRDRYFAALRRMRQFFAPSRFIFETADVEACEPEFERDRTYLLQNFAIDLPAPTADQRVSLFFLSPQELQEIANATAGLNGEGAQIVDRARQYVKEMPC